MSDVMFYEAFKEEEAALKRFLPKNISAEFTWKTIQEHGEGEPPARLICIRTQSHIPTSWINRIDGVLTRSQGYDHLMAVRRQDEVKMSCGYLGNYCARAVAEQAVLSMMALLRKLKKQMLNFSTFNRDGLTGRECRGRKTFVVGVGNIGREIVDIAKGLQMAAKGFDCEHKLKDLIYVSLKEGINWADVVFCALPLTHETNGLLDYTAFQRAQPGLVFINVARGEISPAEDLKKLLDEQILGGVAMDVYPQEPVLAQCLRSGKTIESSTGKAILDLAQNERTLMTPHNAFNTQEALEQKAALSVEGIVCYLKDGKFPCPVPSV